MATEEKQVVEETAVVPGKMEFRLISPTESNFLKHIEWNKEELLAAVRSKVASYEGIVYTEETVKTAKNDRAELNNLVKAIDERRKKVKEVINQPYAEFEKELKEITDLIKKQSAEIDEQVKAFETAEKEEKKAKIMEAYKKAIGNLAEILPFSKVFDQRYLNKTCKLESAIADVQKKIEQVKTDLETIESVCGKYKLNAMPRGNNNYGSDHGYPHEKGTPTYYDNNKIGRVATGSGPDTWSHNWMPDGIFDLNGNVWEWCAGLRLVDGEIQIIPYANSMILTTSMAAGSTEWKAIAADGSLVAPGTAGTLKWDWISGKFQLTNGDVTYKTDQGNGCQYKDMTLASGLTAPELAKALLLYPDEPNGDYGSDYHWANLTGERLPICGGYWNNTSNAGVFYVYLSYPRTDAYGGIGFRSAFVN